ncbi:MAG: HEAT repeat domain-containing protein [Verrucomicrobia bacterium]|nr:HEAT repeat domain-containing protein [Verrucomicrobiota bacterium]
MSVADFMRFDFSELFSCRDRAVPAVGQLGRGVVLPMAIPVAFENPADWRAVDLAVSEFGGTDGWLEQDLLDACEFIERWRDWSLQLMRRPSGEVIPRFDCQAVVWTLGESFRRILRRNRPLRSSERFFQRVDAICLDERLGSGRESFTMLLGHYGGASHIPVLIRLLDDPDVAGHAVCALRRLGAAEAAEMVRPFLESPKTWIRREARKFFEKIEAKTRHLTKSLETNRR